MLSDRNDRRIRAATWAIVIACVVFLMIIVALAGCAHRDMSQREAINITNLGKAFQ